MLTLSMIVKNEEKYLKDCLESVKNIVDEIIIVDTGSTDKTIEIAKAYNSQIYCFDWIDDFSAARNYALSKSSGDWILYLDADERIAPSSKSILKKLTEQKENKAYYCTIKNVDEYRKRPSVMKYVRLFPNSDKIHFTGKIHEQIEPALNQNKIKIEYSPIEIIHIGYNVSDNEFKAKAERNLNLLRKEYQKSASSYIAYQLAQTLAILNEEDEACKYFLISVNDNRLQKEYKSVAYRYLAVKEAERKNWKGAKDLIEKSRQYDPGQPLPLLILSKIQIQLKDFAEAGRNCISAYELNKTLLWGTKANYQTIFLDEKSILYECLNISASLADGKMFNFFFERLNAIDESPLIFELINKLINNLPINNSEKFMGELNSSNLDLILNLVNHYSHPDKKKIFLELIEKYPDNSGLRTSLGLYLSELKLFQEAIHQLEKSYQLQKEPSVIFFLVSAYLQASDLSKIKPLITEAEKIYSSQSAVIEKIDILKQKIYPLLTN